MMIREKIFDIFQKYISKYLEGFDPSQLDIAIMAGTVDLRNISLNKEKINTALSKRHIPVILKMGTVGHLQMKNQFEIVIDDAYVVFGPATEHTKTTSEAEYGEYIANPMINIFNATLDQNMASPFKERKQSLLSVDSEMRKMAKKVNLEKIIKNVKVVVRKLHIRYEDGFYNEKNPYSFGLLCDQIILSTGEHEWKFQSLEHNIFTRMIPNFEHENVILKEAVAQNIKVYWLTNSELIVPEQTEESIETSTPRSYKEINTTLSNYFISKLVNENLLINPFHLFTSWRYNPHENTLRPGGMPKFKTDILFTKLEVLIKPKIINTLSHFVEFIENYPIFLELKKYCPESRPIVGQNPIDKPKRRLIVRDWLFFVVWSIRLKKLYRKLQEGEKTKERRQEWEKREHDPMPPNIISGDMTIRIQHIDLKVFSSQSYFIDSMEAPHFIFTGEMLCINDVKGAKENSLTFLLQQFRMCYNREIIPPAIAPYNFTSMQKNPLGHSAGVGHGHNLQTEGSRPTRGAQYDVPAHQTYTQSERLPPHIVSIGKAPIAFKEDDQSQGMMGTFQSSVDMGSQGMAIPQQHYSSARPDMSQNTSSGGLQPSPRRISPRLSAYIAAEESAAAPYLKLEKWIEIAKKDVVVPGRRPNPPVSGVAPQVLPPTRNVDMNPAFKIVIKSSHKQANLVKHDITSEIGKVYIIDKKGLLESLCRVSYEYSEIYFLRDIIADSVPKLLGRSKLNDLSTIYGRFKQLKYVDSLFNKYSFSLATSPLLYRYFAPHQAGEKEPETPTISIQIPNNNLSICRQREQYLLEFNGMKYTAIANFENLFLLIRQIGNISKGLQLKTIYGNYRNIYIDLRESLRTAKEKERNERIRELLRGKAKVGRAVRNEEEPAAVNVNIQPLTPSPPRLTYLDKAHMAMELTPQKSNISPNKKETSVNIHPHFHEEVEEVLIPTYGKLGQGRKKGTKKICYEEKSKGAAKIIEGRKGIVKVDAQGTKVVQEVVIATDSGDDSQVPMEEIKSDVVSNNRGGGGSGDRGRGRGTMGSTRGGTRGGSRGTGDSSRSPPPPPPQRLPSAPTKTTTTQKAPPRASTSPQERTQNPKRNPRESGAPKPQRPQTAPKPQNGSNEPNLHTKSSQNAQIPNTVESHPDEEKEFDVYSEEEEEENNMGDPDPGENININTYGEDNIYDEGEGFEEEEEPVEIKKPAASSKSSSTRSSSSSKSSKSRQPKKKGPGPTKSKGSSIYKFLHMAKKANKHTKNMNTIKNINAEFVDEEKISPQKGKGKGKK